MTAVKRMKWAKVPKGYTDHKQKRGQYCVAWRNGRPDVVRVLGFNIVGKDPYHWQNRVAYKVIDGPDKGQLYTAQYKPKDITMIRWYDHYHKAAAYVQRNNGYS